MKKYLLSIITVLVMLLTACDSGLNIKERIISSFNENDKTIFLAFVDDLAIDAAKYGFTMGNPLVSDNLLEIIATDNTNSANTYTVKIEIANSEFLVTTTEVSDGQTNESTETYSDLDTWYFYATHSIESREIEGQTVKIEFVENGTDHLSGYLFDENTLTSDTSREIVSVDLWPGTSDWKEIIFYSLTTPDLQVGQLLCDENGNEIKFSSRTTYNYNGTMVDVLGVHIYPTTGNIHENKIYLASTTNGWDVTGATLIAEGTSVEGSQEHTWKQYTDGVLTHEEYFDSYGDSTYKNYDNSGLLTSRGYTTGGVQHSIGILKDQVYDPSQGAYIETNVLSERIQDPNGSDIRTDYLASSCNMETLTYDGNSIIVYVYNFGTGTSFEYDITGAPHTP